LGKTAMVLARFGPRLPGMVEAVLVKQGQDAPAIPAPSRARALGWLGLGLLIGAAAAEFAHLVLH